MLQASVVCDWCGIEEFINLSDPHETVGEWEVVNSTDASDRKEQAGLLADLLESDPGFASSCMALCPDCRPHVTWDEEMELYATTAEGEALQEARKGQYYGRPDLEGIMSHCVV
jgi:hypothetical protein